MTLGGLLVLLSLPRATAIPFLAILGGALIISAPLGVLFTLLHGIGAEKCLVIRRDALVMQQESQETIVRWEDAESVRFSHGVIEVTKKDGTALRIEESFSEPQKIAERMEEVRRKAGFGLI